MKMSIEIATFAEGCFWGVELTYRKVHGVVDAAVGYMGGALAKPTYHDVCTGHTNHAEVVQVKFDTDIISYAELLETFWTSHDPTQLNRQGPDVGTQYRSAIFYHSPEQHEIALASKTEAEASGRFKRPIVSQIVPAAEFWLAEDYHQQYLIKRGLGSCHV
jgi:peptide-methionine (S)-S-oxide reductase